MSLPFHGKFCRCLTSHHSNITRSYIKQPKKASINREFRHLYPNLNKSKQINTFDETSEHQLHVKPIRCWLQHSGSFLGGGGLACLAYRQRGGVDTMRPL